MKKFISVILGLLISLAVNGIAFAAGPDDPDPPIESANIQIGNIIKLKSAGPDDPDPPPDDTGDDDLTRRYKFPKFNL